MLDSDEESVMSERRSLDDGKEIVRKPDLEDIEEKEDEDEEVLCLREDHWTMEKKSSENLILKM